MNPTKNSTRRVSRAASVAGMVLAASTLLLGGSATASTGSQHQATAATSSQAGERAGLHCKTSFGDTGGWVECTGKGTWRAVADCENEPDPASKWVTQTKGPKRQSLECTFGIRGIHYEVR